MTQDIKHMTSVSSVTQKKSANQKLLEMEASGEGSPSSLISSDDSENIYFFREQLTAANNNIAFLQKEHGSMLKNLHLEIERLQELCRDLQFRCEMADCLLPDSEFFRCSPKALEKKVEDLKTENVELRRKLSESLQAIDILDQKEKLALWQHHQELEQRDEAIANLEKELQSKCALITQMTANTAQQGARRKKSNFWRRFSFSSSNAPSTSVSVPHSKVIHPQRVEHLSKEDLPSEMQSNFPSYESQYQSYSSYSSLSDKSMSDDEGLGHRSHHAGGGEKLKDSASVGKSVKLPPIHGLQIRPQVRQQLRCTGGKPSQDSLAIDQIKSTDNPVKRTGKI